MGKGLSVKSRFSEGVLSMSENSKPFFEKINVFLPGSGFGLRLAGLFVTQKGTVIATCQKRKGSMEDEGHETDLLLQCSRDGGKTWGRQEVVFTEPGVNAYLGPIFEDSQTGTIFIAFWKLSVQDKPEMEDLRKQGKAGGGFWLIKSSDQGYTWSDPYCLVPQPNKAGWVGVTGNSVHGIQLACGPCQPQL